jgi:hypothetical protein
VGVVVTESDGTNQDRFGSTVEGLQAEAFAVLLDAVGSLTTEGARPPTASEVRLEMKHRTYGGFDPKLVGFKRFREFLMAAASQGHIALDASRPGDLAVLRPADADQLREPSNFVRSDLWRAFVDWDPRMLRFYDKNAGKALMIPRESVPFEPMRYRDLRRRLEQEPESFIEINPVEMPTQLAWMREYAERVTDADLRSLLKEALDSKKPLKLFTDMLRANPPQLALWHRELGLKVRREVERWRDSAAAEEQIDIERRQPPSSAPGSLSQSHSSSRTEDLTSNARLLRLLRTRLKPSSDRDPSETGSQAEGAELRARLHLAIDRMPLAELKMLRVPVGYLFED